MKRCLMFDSVTLVTLVALDTLVTLNIIEMHWHGQHIYDHLYCIPLYIPLYIYTSLSLPPTPLYILFFNLVS